MAGESVADLMDRYSEILQFHELNHGDSGTWEDGGEQL